MQTCSVLRRRIFSKRMWMLAVASLLQFSGEVTSASNTMVNRRCTTATGDEGRCVTLNVCPSLKEEVRRKVSAEETVADILKICGSNGTRSHVCCPLDEIPKEHPNIELLRKHSCGVFYPNKVYYFVYPGDYPSAALLRLEEADGPKNLCGGSLINERYVLTTGSCLDADPEGKRISVRLGEYNLLTNPDCEDGRCGDSVQDYGIEEVLRYPRHSRTESMANLALIRLNGTANITDSVSPICLPAGEMLSEQYVGEMLLVAGWGITANGTKNSKMWAGLFTVTNTTRCEESLLISADETNLCTKEIEREDSCISDRGGAIMTLEFDPPSSATSYLVGLAADENKCSHVPRLFTRVGPFVNWILDNMRP